MTVFQKIFQIMLQIMMILMIMMIMLMINLMMIIITAVRRMVMIMLTIRIKMIMMMINIMIIMKMLIMIKHWWYSRWWIFENYLLRKSLTLNIYLKNIYRGSRGCCYIRRTWIFFVWIFLWGFFVLILWGSRRI